MNLPNELVSQFAKITNNQNDAKKEETLYGTAVVYGNRTYVILDGSDVMTPVVTTSAVSAGERVTVMIKDHTATITGNISDPSASGIAVDGVMKNQEAIVAEIGQFKILVADKVTTQELNAALANIDTLIADKATINELNAVKATIKDLDVSELRADIAEIEELVAGKISTETLNAEVARIETLMADKATIAELDAVKGTIKDLDVGILQADIARIEEALIIKADITELDAIHAEIDMLDADIADIETLVGGHLTMDNIQSLILTSDKVTVENAFIKDAMIDTINASKINAGSINTNLVSLESEDGSLYINGSLQQFKDNDGNVRIQIGKDAKGDFTFVLYGPNGEGQLINQNGITATAISDGLIVNDMVADDASIDGAKLDINSVVEEINGSSKTIKSSKVQLDKTNQTLEAGFNTLSNTVVQAKSTLESHTTALQISQGKIETLISNTTITKSDGTVTQLKDEYSSTVNTVNQMSAKLGTLTTTVSDNKKAVDSQMSEVTHTLEEIGGSLIDISEDVTTVSDGLKSTNTRVANAESKLTLKGLTTIIGSHYTTSEEVDGKITSKGYATSSEVTQTKTDVLYRFEESGGYNILYNSDFRRDLAHWSLTSGASYSFLNSYDTPNGRAIRILGVSGESKYLAQDIKDTKYLNAKDYTISTYIRINSTGTGGTNEYYRVYARLTYSDGTKEYKYAYNTNGSKVTYDKWQRVSLSFERDTTKDLTEIRYTIETKDNTNYVDIAQVMLQDGKYLTSWSCNPNEACDGIITIDKNGVKVAQSSYNGYTQMKNDGFYVNNGTENVISITANESIFRGKVIVQSGSTVPTSVLSGTISSTQLNDSITNDISTAKTNASNAVTTANTANSTANTAKTTATTASTNASTALSTANTANTNASTALSTANTANTNASSALSTANSVKSTLDSNKTNWSNAYNRVAQWAYGAVTGDTTIDGGYIQANTISANKMAVGDFSNYATVNEFIPGSMLPSTFKYGGTEIKTGTSQCIGSSSSTKQYLMLSDFTRTAFNRYDEIYVEGYLYSHHTATQRVRCSVWGYDADKAFVSGSTSTYTFDLPSKVWTKVSGTIKLTDANWGTKDLVYHLVGIMIPDTEVSADMNIYARAFSFRRKSTGELIVDGSITAEKIAAGSITAEKIAAGAITADMITSGYFSGSMIKGGIISAAEEINFVGGPRMKGNYGDLGAGLYISAPELSIASVDYAWVDGSWTFTDAGVTIDTTGLTMGDNKLLIIGTDKHFGKTNLYAPNGTKVRNYLRVGDVIYQTDTDFKGTLLTDANGSYAKLACLRVEATGDMTCNSLWANTKVYAANVALTSDERLKTDIRYVDQEIQNEGESGLMSPNVKLTTKDMHEFIELIPLASYRMKEEVNSGVDYTYYGFIAQDILYSKVGSELVEYGEVIVNDVSYDEEGKEIITPRKEERLRYSENKFIAFICGALKEEIAQRKVLERKLEELTQVIEDIRNLE